MSDDIEFIEYRLRRLKGEYHYYVKKRGWSDRIGARVEILEREIKEIEEYLALKEAKLDKPENTDNVDKSDT